MPRSDKINFAVYVTLVEESEQVKTVWQSTKVQQSENDKWIKIRSDVNYQKSFRFLFRIESIYASTYILVDVVYYEKPCDQVSGIIIKPSATLIPTTPAPSSPVFDCDFENRLCNWKNRYGTGTEGIKFSIDSLPLPSFKNKIFPFIHFPFPP